jgi:hypothetical protein
MIGIKERGPLEIVEQNIPWVEEPVACLGCGHHWITVRMVGDDYRLMQCPFCGQKNSELAHEAPRFVPTRH